MNKYAFLRLYIRILGYERVSASGRAVSAGLAAAAVVATIACSRMTFPCLSTPLVRMMASTRLHARARQ